MVNNIHLTNEEDLRRVNIAAEMRLVFIGQILRMLNDGHTKYVLKCSQLDGKWKKDGDVT